MQKHHHSQPFISKIRLPIILFLLLGGIGAGIASWYLLSRSFRSENIEILGLTISLFFGLLSITSIVSFFWDPIKYTVNNETLVVNSIFNMNRKTIFLKDILYYTEIEKETENSKWYQLTVYTTNQKIKIQSNLNSNYNDIYRVLVNGKIKNTHLETVWNYKIIRRYSIGILSIGTLLTSIFLNMFLNKDNTLYQDELSTLQSTVSHIVKVKDEKQSYIEIELNEYPNFIFIISGTAYRSSQSEDIIREISKGELIQIDLFKTTYLKHIIKAKALSIFERLFYLNIITVKGLKTKQKTFLSLEEINKQKRFESNSIGFYLIFSAGILLFGAYLVIDTTQKAIYRYPKIVFKCDE